MNATEFMAALNTVEQDHRLVLEKSQALKDIVSYLVEGGDMDPHQLLDRLRDINKYFATEFENHLEEEETTLFPLLEKQKPEGSELVARLRLDHEGLRRKRQDFEDCLEVAGDLEGAGDVEGIHPRMVLRDLLGYGWEFWQVLDNHAHAEARGLHQCIARSLAEDAPT